MSDTTQLLRLAQIRTDGGTQMRAALNHETVTEYADAMRRSETFPPVAVYYDGSAYWLGDGFHRVQAAYHAYGHAYQIAAIVHSGTRRDAILHAAGANADHGIRRTNADKRRAVEALLRDEEWGTWSDREIARICNVSHPMVADVRSLVTGNSSSDQRSYTTKHGTTATMQTQKIGHATDDAKLDRQISKLSASLIAAGWGILNAPPPAQSYVMDDHEKKTKERFNFDRDDRQSLLDALTKAENAQKLYELRHAFDDADPAPTAQPTIVDPLAHDERIQSMDKLADEIRSHTPSHPSPTSPADDPVAAALPIFTQAQIEELIERVIDERASAVGRKGDSLARLNIHKNWKDPHLYITQAGQQFTWQQQWGASDFLNAYLAVGQRLQAAHDATQTPAPVKADTDHRLTTAAAILRSIDALLGDLEGYGALTGRYTDIPPVERNVRVMRAELLKFSEVLKGAQP